MPSVNDPHHEALMQEVKVVMAERGYEQYEADYGSLAEKGIVSRKCKTLMTTNYSVASTIIRTRADRIAVKDDLIFEFDAKTKSNDYDDVFIEAVPVVYHWLMWKFFRLQCLYAFRWPRLDVPDVGFWINEELLQKVSKVWLFDWREELTPTREYIKDNADIIFPNAEVISWSHVRGSGDPAIVIDRSVCSTLPHWKDLIP